MVKATSNRYTHFLTIGQQPRRSSRSEPEARPNPTRRAAVCNSARCRHHFRCCHWLKGTDAGGMPRSALLVRPTCWHFVCAIPWSAFRQKYFMKEYALDSTGMYWMPSPEATNRRNLVIEGLRYGGSVHFPANRCMSWAMSSSSHRTMNARNQRSKGAGNAGKPEADRQASVVFNDEPVRIGRLNLADGLPQPAGYHSHHWR